MNYDYIENLVIKSKDGDEESKENLVNEFKPFIINLSKRTFIHEYDFENIMNECYRILFKDVSYLVNNNFTRVYFNSTDKKDTKIYSITLKKLALIFEHIFPPFNYIFIIITTFNRVLDKNKERCEL